MKQALLLAFLTTGCASMPTPSAIQAIHTDPGAFMNHRVTIVGYVGVQAGKREVWAVGVSGAHTWGQERSAGCLGLQNADPLPVHSLVLALENFESGSKVAHQVIRVMSAKGGKRTVR